MTPSRSPKRRATSPLGSGSRSKRPRLFSPPRDPLGGPAAASMPAAFEAYTAGASSSSAAAPAAAVQAAAAAPVSSSQDFWRVQIEAVYRRRNPYKLDRVPALLERHRGNEVTLYRKICRTYDLKADRFYADERAWDGAEGYSEAVAPVLVDPSAAPLLSRLRTFLGAVGCSKRARVHEDLDEAPSPVLLVPSPGPRAASSSAMTSSPLAAKRAATSSSSFAFTFASGPSPALVGLQSQTAGGVTLEPSAWQPLNADGQELRTPKSQPQQEDHVASAAARDTVGEVIPTPQGRRHGGPQVSESSWRPPAEAKAVPLFGMQTGAALQARGRLTSPAQSRG